MLSMALRWISAAVIAALQATLSRRGRGTISGSVPEVDRAAIRRGGRQLPFALSPSGKIGDVEVERHRFPLSDKPPGKVLMSEFGLSMHLETRRGNETRNVLIDFGYSAPTLLNNLDILGIDPSQTQRDGVKPWPLRSLRRHGWIPQVRPRGSASRSCRCISAARNASVHVSSLSGRRHSAIYANQCRS